MRKSRVTRVRNRVAAVAAVGLMMATGVASASQGADVLCSSSGFDCAGAGYSAASTGTWTEQYYGYPWGNAGHNCTRYAGYRLALNGLADPGRSYGNAADWASNVGSQFVNGTPTVGSIAQWNAYAGGMGAQGHVAYVEEVTADWIVTSEDNLSGSTKRERIYRGEAGWPSNFIHLADVPAFTSTAVPQVTGTGVVDSPLTAVEGTWSPAPDSFTYEWLRNGTTRVGTARNYTPGQADIGHTITLKVTGKRLGYADYVRVSAPVYITTSGAFAFTGAPSALSGTAKVDSTLTATSGLSTSGVTTTITWLRNGTVRQSGGNTLLLTATDIGTSIAVQYTFTKPGYKTLTAASQSVSVAGYSSYAFSGSPASISGTAKVDYSLTASSGLQTSGVTTSITWLKNGVARQAGGTTLALTSADIGSQIAVRYTFSKAGYGTQSFTSPAVTIAGYSTYSFSGSPAALSGTAKVEYSLTASSGLQTSGVSTSIRWYANGVLRQTGGSTLALTSADIGKSITVRYTFDKLGYANTTYTSSAVTVAGYSNYSFSGAPAAVSGTPKVGRSVQAVSGLTTTGVTRTYQWIKNGVAISGATGSTYTLKTTDKGAKISVRITLDRQGYAATSYVSSAVTVTA